MASKQQNIRYTQLEKLYKQLLIDHSEDKDEVICDNAKFAPLVSEALLVSAQIIIYPSQAPALPFIYLSNEDVDMFRVDDSDDLDLFVDQFDRINLGDGVIVFNY